MTFLNVLKLILGEAAEIVPAFIHNPQSQKIEGVVISTLPGVLQAVSDATGKPPTNPPTT